MPGRVAGKSSVDVARHEPDVRGGELPLVRDAARIAQRLELFEVSELVDVDLRLELAPDGFLECLAGLEPPARQGPAPAERRLRPLPQKHVKLPSAHLQDDGERDLRRSRVAPVRVVREFSPHSRKP